MDESLTKTLSFAPQTAMPRRSLLKLGLLTAAAGVSSSIAGCAGPNRVTARRPPRQRVARVAHLSDWHIQPELRAGQGAAQCLHHVQSLDDAPSLVITGGDLVMDAYDQGGDRTKQVFDLFTSTVRSECALKVAHTLGNHDIWGWNKSKSGLSGTEKGYGKDYAVDRLGMPGRYYAFDIGSGPGSWRAIVLDSVRQSRQPGSFGYEAFLDEPQADWLAATLRDTPSDRWVCVVSHIPIISASSLFDSKPGTPLRLHSALMHDDARNIHDLFMRYPNVRLALSGHIHQIDRVEYGGMTYICGGAVCGAWWKGPHNGCHEGYGIVDLNNDGTFDWAYQRYGWEAQPA